MEEQEEVGKKTQVDTVTEEELDLHLLTDHQTTIATIAVDTVHHHLWEEVLILTLNINLQLLRLTVQLMQLLQLNLQCRTTLTQTHLTLDKFLKLLLLDVVTP